MEKKLFLHVGCGTKQKNNTTRLFASDDWQEVRFDIDPGAKPDIVGSMTNMTAFTDASYDAIYSSHNLEHLFPHEVAPVLGNFLRVLKPGGYLIVACPDLEEVCKHVAQGRLLEPLYQSPSGPIAPVDVLYGFRPDLARGNVFMAHRCGFTLQSLIAELRQTGFASILGARSPRDFSLAAIATKEHLEEEALRDLANQHWGNIAK